jgi:hypothetical protein
MRVGILTGAGDCPGLNGVIRAVGRRRMSRGRRTISALEGARRGPVRDALVAIGGEDTLGVAPAGVLRLELGEREGTMPPWRHEEVLAMRRL